MINLKALNLYVRSNINLTILRTKQGGMYRGINNQRTIGSVSLT